MSSEKISMPGMQFDVNPNAVCLGLHGNRVDLESIIGADSRKRKALVEMGVIDSPLDKEIMGTIKNQRDANPDVLFLGPQNIYNMLVGISHKPQREFAKLAVSHSELNYGYVGEGQSILGVLPECQQIFRTKPGEEILEKTIAYKAKLSRLWRDNEAMLNEYLRQVVGENNLNPKNKKVEVSVMAPIYRFQKTSSEEKERTVFYYSDTQTKDLAESKRRNVRAVTALFHTNVQTTMLPYTVMTSDRRSKFDAFLTFLTNKEPYHRFTGESYLDMSAEEEKDKNITKAMAAVYPYWLGYLYRKSSNPVADIQMAINRDAEAFTKLKQGSKKKSRYEAYKFSDLSAEKIAQFFVGKRGITPYEFAAIDFDNRDAVTNVRRNEERIKV